MVDTSGCHLKAQLSHLQLYLDSMPVSVLDVFAYGFWMEVLRWFILDTVMVGRTLVVGIGDSLEVLVFELYLQILTFLRGTYKVNKR